MDGWHFSRNRLRNWVGGSVSVSMMLKQDVTLMLHWFYHTFSHIFTWFHTSERHLPLDLSLFSSRRCPAPVEDYRDTSSTTGTCGIPHVRSASHKPCRTGHVFLGSLAWKCWGCGVTSSLISSEEIMYLWMLNYIDAIEETCQMSKCISHLEALAMAVAEQPTAELLSLPVRDWGPNQIV